MGSAPGALLNSSLVAPQSFLGWIWFLVQLTVQNFRTSGQRHPKNSLIATLCSSPNSVFLPAPSRASPIIIFYLLLTVPAASAWKQQHTVASSTSRGSPISLWHHLPFPEAGCGVGGGWKQGSIFGRMVTPSPCPRTIPNFQPNSALAHSRQSFTNALLR